MIELAIDLSSPPTIATIVFLLIGGCGISTSILYNIEGAFSMIIIFVVGIFLDFDNNSSIPLSIIAIESLSL